MSSTASVRELLDHERRFWNAMKDKDGEAASEMTNDACIVVGAQGVSTIDPPTMARLTREGEWELKRYTFDESTAQVQFLNDEIALVAYKVNERLTVDGKPLTLEANDASVWVRKDGEWRCAMHTESLAGDPFGRDRVAGAGADSGS
ncbi:MAG TPA: nuclear transport factor 2 family protein [Gemmatimonadaceae bacterium]